MVPPERTWEKAGLIEDDDYTITFVENGVMMETESGDSFFPYAGYVSGLQSGEAYFANNLGWFGFKGYQDVLVAEGNPGNMCWDYRTQAAVYTSCTGTFSMWESDAPGVNVYSLYGAKYLYLSPDGGLSDTSGSLYGTVRQRAFPVRCMRMP